MTSRYFVIWCLEDTLAEALESPTRHGAIVGEPRVYFHLFGAGYVSSAEISPHSDEGSADVHQE